MARVLKIDNALKKRFQRKETSRSVNKRDKRVFFLIVCEGEATEPNYFKALQKSLPPNSVNVIMDIKGTGRNTDSLVDFAIKYRDGSLQAYDRVWAIFDRDSFKDSTFNDAIQNGTNNDIQVGWTNEAFELWFLLHFQYVNNAMGREDYKSYLEREITNKMGKPYKYKKNAKDTYTILKTYGNQEQAIEWAKKLDNEFTCNRYATHNPTTKVYKLIEELADPIAILNNRESKI